MSRENNEVKTWEQVHVTRSVPLRTCKSEGTMFLLPIASLDFIILMTWRPKQRMIDQFFEFLLVGMPKIAIPL
jgi:hypothetical protein